MKKQPTAEERLSPFNRELVHILTKKIPGLTLGQEGVGVPLFAEIDGKPVGFARIRRPRSLTCDVQLQCYLKDDSALNQEQRQDLLTVDGGRFYLYRTHNLERAALVLQTHFKDIKRRVAKHKTGKGKDGRGRPLGIPKSFFRP